MRMTSSGTPGRRLLGRRLPDRRVLGLGAALAASGILLVMPAPAQKPATPEPVPAAVAWPKARTSTIPATLPDGSTYSPKLFLDARSSIGTAPSPDGKWLRLVRRAPDASIQQLRRLPSSQHPFFGNIATAGQILAWAENTGTGHPRLWTIDLGDRRPARQVTADTGNASLNDSQFSLTITDGRLNWVSADPKRVDVTQVRSVALTGGPVAVRPENGTWEWSSWPWLVNGVTRPGGSTQLRNLQTKQEIAIHRTAGLQTTRCSPTWCRVIALTADGGSHIDVMHPDGTGRKRIAGTGAQPAISDVVPLERFEVVAQAGPNSDLTRNAQLIVVEIATRQKIELSRDAANVFYAGGVLWWSNGTQDAVNWHTIDLRTV